MTAATLYESMVRYLVGHGWMREEKASGWWWKDGFTEGLIGDAVEQQMEKDGIDFRTMLVEGEPERFWSEVDCAYVE